MPFGPLRFLAVLWEAEEFGPYLIAVVYRVQLPHQRERVGAESLWLWYPRIERDKHVAGARSVRSGRAESPYPQCPAIT